MLATTVFLGLVGVILLVCGILTLRAMDDLDNGAVAQAKRKMAFLKNGALVAMAILVLALAVYIMVERDKPGSASHHPAIHMATVLGLLLGIVLTGALAYNENTAMCLVLRSNVKEAKSQMVPQLLLAVVGAILVLGGLLLGWVLHRKHTHVSPFAPKGAAQATGMTLTPFRAPIPHPDATVPVAPLDTLSPSHLNLVPPPSSSLGLNLLPPSSLP